MCFGLWWREEGQYIGLKVSSRSIELDERVVADTADCHQLAGKTIQLNHPELLSLQLYLTSKHTVR
jgi:hypothetical protein